MIDNDERKRLKKLTLFERNVRQEGYTIIAGVDEAGRGPLAGPVVSCACIIPEGVLFPGVNDSKKLTKKQRKALFEEITSHPDVRYSIAKVSPAIIDEINILQATIQAMIQAVDGLEITPEILLVDGLELPHPTIPSRGIIRGDSQLHCIACASVIAKEARDQMMIEYHEKWPVYGFANHKGYGTEKHRKAIEGNGPCPIHRMSFAPLSRN